MKSAKAVMCDWFTFMLSIPRTEPLTTTQKFTQWSSILAYCVGGFSLLVCPQLWKLLLQLDFQGRTEGYLRLTGLGVLVIGFLLVIGSRSNLQGFKHGPILGSVVGRLVHVNGVLLMLLLRGMLPISFAVVFMGLDTFLALVIIVIWSRETEGASVSLFIREAILPIFKCIAVQSGAAMKAIFFVGIFQMFFWLVFVIRPDVAQNILQLDQFQGHSNGFLASVFFTLSLHGWIHVTNASAVNYPFISAALFYRVLLNVPALVILVLVDQIERNLCIVLLSCDMCFSIIIFLVATFSTKMVSTDDGDEQTLLTRADKD